MTIQWAPPAWVGFGLAALAASLFTACDSVEGPGRLLPLDLQVKQPYAIQLNDKLIPMEGLPVNRYRQVEFGDDGKPLSEDNEKKSAFVYLGDDAFGFEDGQAGRGLILTRRRSGPVDSLGLYVAGEYADGDSLPADPQLWLPEHPESWPGSWRVGNRNVTVAGVDSLLLLPMAYGGQGYARDAGTGRYWVPATIFREEEGNRIGYYAYAKGVGLVAYQLFEGEKLRSTGLLGFSAATSPELSLSLWPR